MKYFKIIPLVIWCISTFQLSGQVTPLPQAHAHNDYEHTRPLQDALDNGFISVEADIYLIDNELYVAHDKPTWKDSTRTLRHLYLNPLLARVKTNRGKIYSNYDDFFYLMIDIKSHGDSTYQVLREQLMDYQAILCMVHDTTEERNKPVKVFLSGHATRRPLQRILNEPVKIAAIDGVPAELGQGIPASLMPVVSMDYRKLLTWKGEGRIDATERKKLQDLVQRTHAERKKLRLWAAPDVLELWTFLLDNGVDLINTDRLPQLRQYLLQRNDKTTNRN